jgi:hypothetical protein
MAQIPFSFSGGFWPISFPLFHGTARPSALETVLVSAYMNGSFVVERSLILIVDQGRLSTRTSRSFFSRADVQKIKLASKDRESGQNHGRPVTLQSSHPIRTKR